jgi:hypothetical protein
MQCLDDVINLNGFSEDVSLAIEKAVKPTYQSLGGSHTRCIDHYLEQCD